MYNIGVNKISKSKTCTQRDREKESNGREQCKSQKSNERENNERVRESND